MSEDNDLLQIEQFGDHEDRIAYFVQIDDTAFVIDV